MNTPRMPGRIQWHVLASAGLGIVALAQSLVPAVAQPPQPAAARKVFANSVTPLPLSRGVQLEAPGVSHDNDTMQILFSLPIPADAKARLEARVAR